MARIDTSGAAGRDGDSGRPGRGGDGLEQAPLFCRAIKGYPDGGGRQDQAHQQRIEQGETEVIQPAGCLALGQGAARGKRFPDCHGKKNAEEETKPEGDLVREQKHVHGDLFTWHFGLCPLIDRREPW